MVSPRVISLWYIWPMFSSCVVPSLVYLVHGFLLCYSLYGIFSPCFPLALLPLWYIWFMVSSCVAPSMVYLVHSFLLCYSLYGIFGPCFPLVLLPLWYIWSMVFSCVFLSIIYLVHGFLLCCSLYGIFGPWFPQIFNSQNRTVKLSKNKILFIEQIFCYVIVIQIIIGFFNLKTIFNILLINLFIMKVYIWFNPKTFL